MTGKQKAAILSGLITVSLNGAYSIMLLIFIKAPEVLWLMFWFNLAFGFMATCLIKYIFEAAK